MAVNDILLAQKMTRVRVTEDRTVIEVAVIHWDSQTPCTSWVVAMELPLFIEPEHIRIARNKLVKNRKFFALCSECGERCVKGQMSVSKICQSCVESNHGVVF